jgi:hypothetical protein
MKTYTISVTASNTIQIKLQANGYFEACNKVFDELAKTSHDLFNPGLMSVDYEVEDEADPRSAYTLMQGTEENARELCDELNKLLGRDEFVTSCNGKGVVGISADELTNDEVERLNLTEDFIIK